MKKYLTAIIAGSLFSVGAAHAFQPSSGAYGDPNFDVTGKRTGTASKKVVSCRSGGNNHSEGDIKEVDGIEYRCTAQYSIGWKDRVTATTTGAWIKL